MAKSKTSVSVEDINRAILALRGYALNQAVKRNAERFPDDFRFQLTANLDEKS